LYVYVEDVDKVFKKAIEEGAKEITAPMDMHYGDRSGRFADPFGHVWNVSTHIEDHEEKEEGGYCIWDCIKLTSEERLKVC